MNEVHTLKVINFYHNFGHMQFIIGTLQKFAHNKMCIRIFRPGKWFLFFLLMCLFVCIAYVRTNKRVLLAIHIRTALVCACVCVPMLWKFVCFKSFSSVGVSGEHVLFFCLSLSSVSCDTIHSISGIHSHLYSLSVSIKLSRIFLFCFKLWYF